MGAQHSLRPLTACCSCEDLEFGRMAVMSDSRPLELDAKTLAQWQTSALVRMQPGEDPVSVSHSTTVDKFERPPSPVVVPHDAWDHAETARAQEARQRARTPLSIDEVVQIAVSPGRNARVNWNSPMDDELIARHHRSRTPTPRSRSRSKSRPESATACRGQSRYASLLDAELGQLWSSKAVAALEGTDETGREEGKRTSDESNATLSPLPVWRLMESSFIGPPALVRALMCADKYVCVQESVRSEYKHMFLREARMRQHEAVEEERQRRKEEAVVLDVLNRRARRLCVCVRVRVCALSFFLSLSFSLSLLLARARALSLSLMHITKRTCIRSRERLLANPALRGEGLSVSQNGQVTPRRN